MKMHLSHVESCVVSRASTMCLVLWLMACSGNSTAEQIEDSSSDSHTADNDATDSDSGEKDDTSIASESDSESVSDTGTEWDSHTEVLEPDTSTEDSDTVLRDSAPLDSDVPVSCPPGTFGPGNGDCTQYTNCGPGQYISIEGTQSTDRVCQACPSGAFNPLENVVACTSWKDCIPGQFVHTESNTVSDRVCAGCASDKYSTAMNAAECVPHGTCAAGTYETAPGSATEPPECTGCPTGHYCAGQQLAPEPCEAGTWDGGNTASPCQDHTECSAGSYIETQGDATSDYLCAPCPDSTFCDTIDASSCSAWTTCDTNEYESMPPSAINDRECSLLTDCGNGEYIFLEPTNTTDRACETCPPGTTSTGPNALDCTPVQVVQFSSLSAGDNITCGIRASDDKIQCWPTGLGSTNPPADTTYSVVDAGFAHTCAIRDSDNKVDCFGAGTQNTGSNMQFGQSMAPSVAFVSISAGQYHSCGIRASDKAVVCWGSSSDGKTSAQTGTEYTHVSVGDRHSCALNINNRVRCWGHNFFLQDVDPAGDFLSIDAGNYHNCGIRASDNTVYCWGNNNNNQSSAPSNIEFDQVSAGYYHSCGIRSDNKQVVCWGGENEDYGQTKVSTTDAFIHVEAGRWHTCGLRASDNLVVCWGRNTWGQTNSP